jgi:hypothetical protein
MRITAFLPTHDLAEEAMPWMAEARDIFDDLVIFIDEKRVTPGTVSRAEKVASRVYHHEADTWYEWDLGAMARMCESDWIFLIERDEQFSPDWRQNQWRQILETTSFTHFWLLRRWVVPGGRFINCDPWWPDFQMRLFRNNLEGTTFPTELHDIIRVPGYGASFANLAIYHHVLWLCPRKVREERVRYYEQLRPGEGMGHYYLPEDYSPPEAPLPQPSVFDPNREIASMNKLSSEEISNISLEASNVSKAVRISELFWIDVKVTNETSENLHPHPPLGVYLAYHWIDKMTRSVAVFEGHRAGLFPFVPANTTTASRISVMAPAKPGQYILQVTMVQEGVAWFEHIQPDILQEFTVLVEE